MQGSERGWQDLVQSPAVRTLTVYSRWGLANRLRVLLSGLALAEASQRGFRMLWPRDACCGATFQELFGNDWNVVDGAAPAGMPLYGLELGGARWRDLLQARETHVIAGGGAWLVRPERYPAHAALMVRCAQLLDELTPIAAVQERTAQARRSFRPVMVGVHVRCGDFVRVHGGCDLGDVLVSVDAALAALPGAGVFLCTDDGAVDPQTRRPTKPMGVVTAFSARYGDRLVTTRPRSLDRASVEAVQDALVDFLLLRGADSIVGSLRSSFSILASFGRDVPHVMCGPGGPPPEQAPFWAYVTGVYPAVKLAGRLQYGHDAPFGDLLSHYRSRLLERWSKVRARAHR